MSPNPGESRPSIDFGWTTKGVHRGPPHDLYGVDNG